jgi:hypothetical protein
LRSGRALYPVSESNVFRAEANQAAFAAFFFAFGSGAIVAFMFALEAPFNAAQRLICACRPFCAQHATLSGFLNLLSRYRSDLCWPTGLTFGDKSALACSRRAISASISARMSFTMVCKAPPIEYTT